MADGTVGTRPYRHALNPRPGTTTAASAIRRDRRATSKRVTDERMVASDGSGGTSADSTARSRPEISLVGPVTGVAHPAGSARRWMRGRWTFHHGSAELRFTISMPERVSRGFHKRLGYNGPGL